MSAARSQLTPEQKVLRFIRERRLIPPGQKLVVAVSGGPDSVCMLHLLRALRKELDIELHIAHLNHQLRGVESNADAAYVAELARKFKIPATIESRDVKAYRSEKRLSLEEAAREVRYTFLGEVADKVGAERVAVGHTADDHIETVLMHLLRGSGTGGLRGLLPVNTRHNLTVIRPLLELTREETAAYCKRHRLNPRIDATNLSLELFRNRVRLQLLPELEKFNPRVREALTRTARIAADDVDFITREAELVRDKALKTEAGSVTLDKKKMLAQPPALQRYLLRMAVETLLGSLKDIEAKHIEDLLEALEKPAGKTIGLPEGLDLTIEYDRFILSKDAAALCPYPALEKEVGLIVPGKTSLKGWEVEANIVSPVAHTGTSAENEFTAEFDFNKTGKQLTVRRLVPGDSFQPLGMASPKKVNRFMIDARIPRAWRSRVPIVAAEGQIIWVAGRRIDERVKVTEKTKRVLRLKFTRK